MTMKMEQQKLSWYYVVIENTYQNHKALLYHDKKKVVPDVCFSFIIVTTIKTHRKTKL